MNLDQITVNSLRTFVTVAIYKNITKTASELGLSQPGVTKRIKHIEEVFGLKLFFYKNKELYLTSAAKSLIPAVKKILKSVDDIPPLLESYKVNLHQGTINLGVIKTAQDAIFEMLKGFLISYKGITVNIMFLEYLDIMEMLSAKKIDFGIMGSINKKANMDVIKCASCKLRMIAPKSYAHLADKEVNISDLVNEKKILGEKGSNVRDAMESIFTEKQLINSMEINSNYAIISAVASGLGIALVSEALITKSKEDTIQVLKMKDLSITVDLNLISLINNKPSKINQLFKNYIKKFD